MSVFSAFLSEYGPTLLSALVTAVFGYLGMVAKRLWENYATDRTREAVVNTCVKAVEQLYRDLSGEEKLDKAIASASEILAGKGITVSELELRLLIESAVLEYKKKVSA